MLEKLKTWGQWAGAVLAALLYFLLRRQRNELADFKGKAAIEVAQKGLDGAVEKVNQSSANYDELKSQYDKLRNGGSGNVPPAP